MFMSFMIMFLLCLLSVILLLRFIVPVAARFFEFMVGIIRSMIT